MLVLWGNCCLQCEFILQGCFASCCNVSDSPHVKYLRFKGEVMIFYIVKIKWSGKKTIRLQNSVKVCETGETVCCQKGFK